MHFEVYGSLTDATSGGAILATSQLAMPTDTCAEVYATAGYEQSVSNFARTSLATDNVFRDDQGAHQVPTVSGDTTSGLSLSLAVGV
jgi:hypothetical protein